MGSPAGAGQAIIPLKINFIIMKRIILITLILLVSYDLISQVIEEPAGRVSGLFFIDYFVNAQRDPDSYSLQNQAIGGEQGVHGLRIKRIYFTYDYRFSSRFSSRFRLESDEANFTTNSSANNANKFGMFVKDANIKWNFAKGHEVIFGIQATPAYEISEMVWGNRYIEKTIMDLRKIVPSRDMAISLKGRIDKKGRFNYWLMYGNNNPGNPEKDKYKRFYALLEVIPLDKFYFTLYTDLQSKQAFENAFNPGENLKNNTLTYALFAGYRNKDVFSGGVEIYKGITQNGYQLVSNYSNLNSWAVSVFGTWIFNDTWNVFARYDFYEPNNHHSSSGDRRNLIIAGFTVKPAEKFLVSPNICIENFESIVGKQYKSSITHRISVSWGF